MERLNMTRASSTTSTGSSMLPPPSKSHMTSALDAAQLQAQTSLNIFRSFMRQNSDGSFDARGVISVECYRMWLRSRKTLPSCPEKAFQRALSGHLTGVDGRVPFDIEEEEAILRVLRRKARWECFRHCDVKFGESGFRAKGFHEKAVSGEILKSRPKKRAKRAIERLRKMSRLSPEYANEDLNDDEEEEEDEEEDGEESSGASDTHSDKIPSNLVLRKHPSEEEEVGEDETEADSVASYTRIYPSAEESSVSALNMQIPRFVTPLSAPALTVLTMLVNTVTNLAANGKPWADTINSLTRTVMLSRGWFGSPNEEQVRKVLDGITNQYPGSYVIIHDYTCTNYADRILMQNDEAIRIFGDISKNQGGFRGTRIPGEEIWKVLRAFAEVATAPAGTEVRTRLRMVTKSKDDALFEGVLIIDDVHKIIIERGRQVDDAQMAAAAALLSSSMFGHNSNAKQQQANGTTGGQPVHPSLRGLPAMFPFGGGMVSLNPNNNIAMQPQNHQSNRQPTSAAATTANRGGAEIMANLSRMKPFF